MTTREGTQVESIDRENERML